MNELERIRELAASSTAWPFAEARQLVNRYSRQQPKDGSVIFETGYGPSGLPHIGTFAEVARTSMVQVAFGLLSDLPSRLICYSDDMDGLRTIPQNVPNSEVMTPHLGKPLTAVPDPFGRYSSFAHHNNTRLRAFLDRFGFDYDFYSSTDCYRSGRFDKALKIVLRQHDAIRDLILPTLRKERRATYSPFLPICPSTGVVLQVPILEKDVESGTITFRDALGKRRTVPVTGGNVKCQWKVDWAMRWYALGVDYEMAGKDLLESMELSRRITQLMGGRPPQGFIYELFLDENGEKISKSKGNGLSIEEWLAYGTPESLSLFLYRKPRRAKRLFIDTIPKTMDEYIQLQDDFSRESLEARLRNPLFHVHRGDVPQLDFDLSYSILVNLASVAHVTTTSDLWQFVQRYRPESPEIPPPQVERILTRVLRYYVDFVQPTLNLRSPTPLESQAFSELVRNLRGLEPSSDEEEIQAVVYKVGKTFPFDSLRDWFRGLYECLLGQSEGPRMGTLIYIYGIESFIDLVMSALENSQPDGAE